MDDRHASRRKARASAASDESGMTMVEMVIAIPIVFLILGLVFSTIGVTIGLMGQVTESAAAARSATSAMDQLSEARNCAEVAAIVSSKQIPEADSKTVLSFDYECSEIGQFPMSIEVRNVETDKLYYSKALTLAVM